MKYQFFFIVTCILIIILIYLKGTKIEQYDGKIANMTKKDCGIKCTNTYECSGFAHKANNSCYLSKTPILSAPIDKVYASDYTPSDYRCNKLQPIYRVDDITVPETMKRNALYNCSESEQGEYVLELISPFKTEPIYDFDDVESLDVPQYDLHPYDWPITRNEKINTINGVNDYLVYEKSEDEYLGQYLYPHRCVDNIPENKCLDICKYNKDCVGVEWNPFYVKSIGKNNVYNIYQNVCCPKKQIKTVIPRRKDFENGRFYLKTYQDKLNKNTYMTFIN